MAAVKALAGFVNNLRIKASDEAYPKDDGEPVPEFLTRPRYREQAVHDLEGDLKNVVRSPFGAPVRPRLLTGAELVARLDPNIKDFGENRSAINAFLAKVGAVIDLAEFNQRQVDALQVEVEDERAKNQTLLKENMLLRDALRMLANAAQESAALTLLTPSPDRHQVTGHEADECPAVPEQAAEAAAEPASGEESKTSTQAA